ncbi:unnamed protein product [Lupinus luteus]|uniref:RRM domain-containing protein n=1 Tax=Lupinus luteus TaxID=3873 RepID=A0AAV1YE07_LUPLU
MGASAVMRQVCSNIFHSHQFLFLRSFSSKIFVKGLAFSTTEQNLAEAFSQFGTVLNANIVLNKAKTRSKGFGYVTFATEEEAREAQIGMDKKILHGRVLYVDMQPPRKQSNTFSQHQSNDV